MTFWDYSGLKMTPRDYFWGLLGVRKGALGTLKRQSIQMGM